MNATLNVAPKLQITTLRLKAAKRGRPYAAKLATGGSVQPVKWKTLSGRLPLGVGVATKTGMLAGTPRRTGTFSFIVAARDALGGTWQKTFFSSRADDGPTASVPYVGDGASAADVEFALLYP